MKSISKIYNHICTPKYQQLGFTKSKLTFARIRGDILQAFTLKLLPNHPTCSIYFAVFPLCAPGPFFLDSGGYDLCSFITAPSANSSGWSFDPHSDESKTHCIESLSQAIDLYLLPLFERCVNCEATLSELTKLEELFDDNRQKLLQNNGEFDRAIPWQQRSLFDSRKYYMALKSHDFAYAHRYLQHKVHYYDSKLKSFYSANSPSQPEIVKERFASKLALSAKHLERLMSGDIDFFDEMLRTNEVNMIQFLAEKYPQIAQKHKST